MRVGDPMMGLASLQDEEDRPELPFTLPGEDTVRRLMSANHEGSSRGTKSASTLILDFLTSRNYKPSPPACYRGYKSLIESQYPLGLPSKYLPEKIAQ